MSLSRTCLVILVVTVVFRGVPVLAGGDREARYEALIRQATAHLLRGLVRKEERARAAVALEQLRREKEDVARFIISRLVRKPDEWKLGRHELGHVLWQLGPEYVRALDPDVLRSREPKVREAGVRIMGQGGWKAGRDHPGIVDTVVRRLRDDPDERVQGTAIEALEELRAVNRSDDVLPFLESEKAFLRRTAVFFFWHFPSAKARPILERRLKEETDRGVCTALARTLCRYDDPPVEAMLSSAKPGVRQGVSYSWRIGYLRRKPDAAFILSLVETERDPVCRAELSLVLATEHHPQCIGLLVETLQRTKWPADVEDYPTTTATYLANLTDLPYRVTDEDRKAGGNPYARIARLYLRWWEKNGEHVCWDEARSKFVVGE